MPKKPNKSDAEVYCLIQEAFKRYSSGKLSFERLSRYEMIELGFDPNNPQDVLKYDKFMNDLAETLKILFHFI